MALFHGNVKCNSDDSGKVFPINDPSHNRRYAIAQTMYNAKDMTEMPIEIALNLDTDEYFVNSGIPFSTKSIAMSHEIRKAIGKLSNVSEEEVALLNEATRDLANGNFLGNGSNLDMRMIQDPALSSIKGAVEKLLQLAKDQGLNITEAREKEIINSIFQKANTPENLGKYIVRGDFY